MKRLLASTLLSILATCAFAGDKNEPELLEKRTFGVELRGTTAYVGRTGGLDIVDLADPAQPETIGTMALRATVHALELDGDRLLLAAGPRGLLTIDVADPEALRFGLRIDRTGSVRDVIWRAPYALLAESREGFGVLDLSDPERPHRTGQLISRADLRRLALDGTTLAVAETRGGARVVDLTRPDQPRERSRLDVDDARDVCFVGDRLVVAAGADGVIVYDRVATTEPRELGRLSWEHAALRATPIDGRHALVSLGSSGIAVVDTYGENGPVERSRLRLPGGLPAMQASVEGGMAVIALDRWGLAVLRLESLDEPELLYPRARRMRVEDP